MSAPETVAAALNEALPYIRRFRGQTFVIKYGGSALAREEALRSVLGNVLLLQLVGIRCVLVHGGGPEIDRWLERLGIEKKTLNGLRVTDDATMEIVEMVLAGRTNKAVVSLVQQLGGRAVGLSGRDGNLFVAEPIAPELGRVGHIIRVHADVVQSLIDGGLLPVICSIAVDGQGDALNVNADSAAAALAAGLRAAKLIMISDTNGVLANREDPMSTIATLSAADARAMIAEGRADRGMIPKLEAAVEALEDGVREVHLIGATTPHALLIEIFTDHGVGTMVVRS